MQPQRHDKDVNGDYEKSQKGIQKQKTNASTVLDGASRFINFDKTLINPLYKPLHDNKMTLNDLRFIQRPSGWKAG